MFEASRRSFVTGLVALVAAPAIVRAGSLMPVNSGLQPSLSLRDIVEYAPGQAYVPLDVAYGTLTLDSYSERVIAPMVNRLAEQVAQGIMDGRNIGFVLHEDEDALDAEFISDRDFYVGEQWGMVLQLLSKQQVLERWPVPQIPDSLALAAAAVAIAPVVLTKPVTRRFWAK